jgi:structural maintenance of chromosome 1
LKDTFFNHAVMVSNERHPGLHRLRDSLFAELRDLNKSKPRGKADENLIAEINRLESTLLIVKDDLVCHVSAVIGADRINVLFSPQTACEHKLTGVNDELKHIVQELKKHRPEQTKVTYVLSLLPASC